MRVLLATHVYPPGHLGGTEVLTEGLAKTLQASGHAVGVVCAEDFETAPSHRPRVSRGRVDGIDVTRLHFNWKKAPDVFRSLYDNPDVESWFVDRLAREPVDVLHITSCCTLSASVISAARRRGVPVMLSATDFWFVCARLTLLRGDGELCAGPDTAWTCARCLLHDAKVYRWGRRLLTDAQLAPLLLRLGRWPIVTNRRGLRGMLGDWSARFTSLRSLLQRLDLIVTSSEFLRERLVHFGAPPDRTLISTYGLDVAGVPDSRPQTDRTGLRVGFIGQMIPAKGPDLLVRAVRSLSRDLPVTAAIYGDLDRSPGYGGSLAAEARGDDRIRFCGTFDPSRIGAVLSSLDVLVVPSLWYDFPLVIPSAFAAGTPVVATGLPGMNEWVRHEENGLLFERGNWEALAEAIRRLASEPGLLERVRAGIRPVKTMREFTDECVGFYGTLTGAPA